MKPLLAALAILLHPSPNPMKLTQYYGDLVTHSIPLTRAGVAFVPGDDWNLIFTAKRRSTDPDTSALIQKTTGAGLTVTGSTAAVEIVPQDTDSLLLGVIVWDVQALNLSTGAVATVAEGRLNLTRDITRSTTVSVPIYTTTPPVLLGPPGKSAYQLAVDGGYSGTQQQWLASLGGSSAPLTSEAIATALGFSPHPIIIRGYYDGPPENGAFANLLLSGTLSPDVTGECFFVDDLTGEITWTNYIDSSPQTCIIGHYFDSWWINLVFADTNYSAYVVSDAPTPAGLTGWTLVKGTGQPTIAMGTGAAAGTAGLPGQICIHGNNDVYMCVRQSPVKWVKLNNDSLPQ